MESTSPSGKLSEPPPHRWAKFFGTAIAFITLVLPIYTIASFSPPPDASDWTKPTSAVQDSQP